MCLGNINHGQTNTACSQLRTNGGSSSYAEVALLLRQQFCRQGLSGILPPVLLLQPVAWAAIELQAASTLLPLLAALPAPLATTWCMQGCGLCVYASINVG